MTASVAAGVSRSRVFGSARFGGCDRSALLPLSGTAFFLRTISEFLIAVWQNICCQMANSQADAILLVFSYLGRQRFGLTASRPSKNRPETEGGDSALRDANRSGISLFFPGKCFVSKIVYESYARFRWCPCRIIRNVNRRSPVVAGCRECTRRAPATRIGT